MFTFSVVRTDGSTASLAAAPVTAFGAATARNDSDGQIWLELDKLAPESIGGPDKYRMSRHPYVDMDASSVRLSQVLYIFPDSKEGPLKLSTTIELGKRFQTCERSQFYVADGVRKVSQGSKGFQRVTL